jgi:phosphoribosylglycinamide formyltransferase-1
MPDDRIGILISGRGSNMTALIDAAAQRKFPADIIVVISNVESAPGLTLAGERGIETLVISNKGMTRVEHDLRIIDELRSRRVTLVCLAGYMRLISPLFVESFKNRILNIHPSLLPAFPGLNAQRQALEHGVKVTGCTVHIVNNELDGGPIVMQRAVAVGDSDTVESLSARILEQEHLVYSEAVAKVLSPGFTVEGRITRVIER